MKVYFTSSLLTLLAAAFSNGKVVINEIAYRGSGDDTCDGKDWIELLNSGVDAVDLTNYVLHNDKGADDEDAAILSSGIGPGEILLLCKDTDFEFGIANSDTMNLVDPTGTLIDLMPLPGTGSDKETYNLVIDTNTSDSTYSYSTTQTPGAPNVVTIGLPLEEKPRSQNEEGADFFLDNEDSEFDTIASVEEGHSMLHDHSNLASSKRFLRPAATVATKAAARLFGAQRELRGKCENSDSFRFVGDETKTCDSFVAKKPNKRCKKKQLGTDIKLEFFCPATCKSQCKKTDSPTSSPTVQRKACDNSDSFRFEGDETKTCDSFVAEKPNKRCKKKQLGTNIKLEYFCPATCKSQCKKTDSPTSSPTVKRGACTNLDSFQFEGDATRTCDSYVAEKPNKRCEKVQPGTDKKLRFFCPATCKSKCNKTDSPTPTPTSTPTSSPTSSPTTPPSISKSSAPSLIPSVIPTLTTSSSPSLDPSDALSSSPSASPSDDPSISPSDTPSTSPSVGPSGNPSASPSDDPSASPSDDPSASPSDTPSTSPSVGPSGNPSASPSNAITLPPTKSPTSSPTRTICTTSSECSTGFCAIRKLTGNVCESDCQPYGCIETASDRRLDNRAYCKRSSQCKSGRCSSSSDDLSHTCEDRCGAYGCEDIGKTELDLGEGCQANNQCKSSKCASGLCSNVCYNTCPGLTSIARPGGRSNDQCCDRGSDCRSGLCCYSLIGCDTCEDFCGLDSVGVIAGENKPNNRKCEDNMNCASLRCSTTSIGENTCESECGAFGCEGNIVGVDLPIDATCDISNQCESGRCSTDAFGNDTCETSCGLFGCEGVTGIGARCYRDADCESGRCAWDVDFSSGFQVGECRTKLAAGDYCPLGEFGACEGDLSCAGFPGDGNAACANEDNIDFAQRFAEEIIDEFGRIPNALAYFDDILGQLEVPTSLDEFTGSPYPLNIDVNSLDINQFGDEIDDLVGFILGSDSYEQQRRRLGDEEAFQLKIFANVDSALIGSLVLEVGIILLTGGQGKNVNIGVYISTGIGFGLDIGGDVGAGVGLVFDGIDGVGGNNGCIYLEASLEVGLGLAYCGVPYFDGIKGPSEIIVAPTLGLSLGVGYVGTRTFLAACTFGNGGDDGEIPRGCRTYGSISI